MATYVRTRMTMMMMLRTYVIVVMMMMVVIKVKMIRTYVLSEQADDDARVWAFFGSVKRQGHDIELDAHKMYSSCWMIAL